MFVVAFRNILCINKACAHRLKRPRDGGTLHSRLAVRLLLRAAATAAGSRREASNSVSRIHPHPGTSCLKQTQTAFPPSVAKWCYRWRCSASQKNKKTNGWPSNFLISQQPLTSRGPALASKSQRETRSRHRTCSTDELRKTLRIIINHNPIFCHFLLTKKKAFKRVWGGGTSRLPALTTLWVPQIKCAIINSPAAACTPPEAACRVASTPSAAAC